MPCVQSRISGASPENEFHGFLESGMFRIQKCGGCGGYIFYPRLLCTECGSADLSWVAPSGLGEVYSTTIVRRRPADGGDYNVALIELDEGVRLMSRVEGIAPGEVRIGMRVRADIVRDEGATRLIFRAEGAGR